VSVEDSNFHLLPRIPDYLQSDFYLNTSIFKKTLNIVNESVNLFVGFNFKRRSLDSIFDENVLNNFNLFNENPFLEFEASYRLEYFHESTVAVTMFLLLTLALICLILSWKQPLKARGASSYESDYFISLFYIQLCGLSRFGNTIQSMLYFCNFHLSHQCNDWIHVYSLFDENYGVSIHQQKKDLVHSK
jgi:hypothetical protein